MNSTQIVIKSMTREEKRKHLFCNCSFKLSESTIYTLDSRSISKDFFNLAFSPFFFSSVLVEKKEKKNSWYYSCLCEEREKSVEKTKFGKLSSCDVHLIDHVSVHSLRLLIKDTF